MEDIITPTPITGYIIVDNQAQAQDICDTIYVKILKAKIGSGKAINIETDKEVSIRNKPQDELLDHSPEDRIYPIFGFRNGIENQEDGYTTAYAEPIECEEGWAIPYPTGYEIDLSEYKIINDITLIQYEETTK